MRRQGRDILGAGAQANFAAAQAITVVEGVGALHVAVAHRALHQKPACRLHQAGGDAHAFAGIEHRRLARQCAGLLAAFAVEIAGGLLHQRHAFIEGAIEHRRIGEARDIAVVGQHHVLDQIGATLPSRARPEKNNGW